jgi:hypothetical protein
VTIRRNGLAANVSGNEFTDFESGASSAEMEEVVLDSLDIAHLKVVGNYIRVTNQHTLPKWCEENDYEFEDTEDDIKEVVEELGLEDVKEAFRTAYWRGEEAGRSGDIYKAFRHTLEGAQAPEGTHLEFPELSSDDRVYHILDIVTACGLADNGMDWNEIGDDYSLTDKIEGDDVDYSNWDKEACWESIVEELGAPKPESLPVDPAQTQLFNE